MNISPTTGRSKTARAASSRIASAPERIEGITKFSSDLLHLNNSTFTDGLHRGIRDPRRADGVVDAANHRTDAADLRRETFQVLQVPFIRFSRELEHRVVLLRGFVARGALLRQPAVQAAFAADR